ncbi:MAG: hypothetical protein JWL80_343 [Parcubacteria group bacterium]|nr:hypothetical protein [Parcubacteria group bacterium]
MPRESRKDVPTPESLGDECDALVANTEKYVRSQKGLWQKVPRLALMADNGYAKYGDAWKRGYWKVFLPHNPHYALVHIDLATGELCSGNGSGERASASEILSILPYNKELDLLSAKKVVADLRKAAKKEHEPIPGEVSVKIWRDKMLREVGLQKVFVRQGPHL